MLRRDKVEISRVGYVVLSIDSHMRALFFLCTQVSIALIGIERAEIEVFPAVTVMIYK